MLELVQSSALSGLARSDWPWLFSSARLNFFENSQIFFGRFLNFSQIFNLPCSREQKHVSISDTPMLLIEINLN